MVQSTTVTSLVHLLVISALTEVIKTSRAMEKTMAQSELLFQEQMALSLICGVTVIQRRTALLLQPEHTA